MTFSTFLKKMDSILHSQYSFEKYSEGKQSFSNADPVYNFLAPVFKTKEETLLDNILDSLDTLPHNHEAVEFCTKRKIPYEKFKQIYFIENIKNIVQLNDKYKESIKGEEPRLVLPFYDDNGQLSGVTCRALRGEALRYITVKVKEDAPLIFGINEVNKSNLIYVVEGPIDSLFLNNSIAVSGTGFNKLQNINIDKEKLVVVIDNQPRNKEVCKVLDSVIARGYSVVIWPQNIEEKDINEMVLAGKDIKSIIAKNVYNGLAAKAKFIGWKRC